MVKLIAGCCSEELWMFSYGIIVKTALDLYLRTSFRHLPVKTNSLLTGLYRELRSNESAFPFVLYLL